MDNYNQNLKSGVFICLSGNANLKVESIKKMIDYLSKFGYQYIELGLDDVFKIDEEPYYGYLRGSYTVQQLKELDLYAAQHNIELIPSAQCLGHFWALSKIPEYEEIIDINDVLLIDSPRVEKLLDNMFKTLRQAFSTKNINIGFDEAHLVGLGKYLDQHGYTDRFKLMLKHLNKVNEIAHKYEFNCHMWSDMFFKMANHGVYYDKGIKFSKEIINLVPKDVGLCYWDYYSEEKELISEMVKSHKEFNKELYFAGSISTCSGFAPANKAGLRILKNQLEVMREENITNIMITLWGDNGNDCNYFAALPGLFMAREYMLGNFNENEAKEKFKKITNIDFDLMMKLDLPERSPVNPNNENITLICKSLLYNDPFMGWKDFELENVGEIDFMSSYKELDEAYKLAPKEWKYLFKKERDLCLFLSYKYDLGIKTRRAYLSKNKKELNIVIKQYKRCLKSLKTFKESFLEEWKVDNKMHSWDVQETRLGGLYSRIEYCMNTLIDYKKGKVNKIEELEEKLLKYAKFDSMFNIYRTFVTLRDL